MTDSATAGWTKVRSEDPRIASDRRMLALRGCSRGACGDRSARWSSPTNGASTGLCRMAQHDTFLLREWRV